MGEWGNLTHPFMIMERRQYMKEWRAKNRESDLASRRRWNESHKGYRRNWKASRKSQNVAFRLECNLRRRLSLAIARNPKAATTKKLLGCSMEHLRMWLTFYFQPGMSWANYGTVWHIDHVYPCSRFDLSDPEQQKECFHYTNLQPLFVAENLSKGNKILV